jgi:hypothetical protein
MANLQQIFDRIQESKKEQKDLKSMYRDALINSQAMQQTQEDLLKLRDKKKKIEEGIRDDFRHEFDKLEVLKAPTAYFSFFAFFIILLIGVIIFMYFLLIQ